MPAFCNRRRQTTLLNCSNRCLFAHPGSYFLHFITLFAFFPGRLFSGSPRLRHWPLRVTLDPLRASETRNARCVWQAMGHTERLRWLVTGGLGAARLVARARRALSLPNRVRRLSSGENVFARGHARTRTARLCTPRASSERRVSWSLAPRDGPDPDCLLASMGAHDRSGEGACR